MISRRPILTTIIFGMICGFSYLLVSTIPGYIIPKTTAFRLAVWTYLTGYALLLTHWGKAKRLSIAIPLIILFIFIFLKITSSGFLLIAIGILSWIRGGICFPGSVMRTIIAELMICFGAGALVASFMPFSPMTWALGIWMFFLIQSVYFVIFSPGRDEEAERITTDPFEKARKQAEEILSNEI